MFTLYLEICLKSSLQQSLIEALYGAAQVFSYQVPLLAA